MECPKAGEPPIGAVDARDSAIDARDSAIDTRDSAIDTRDSAIAARDVDAPEGDAPIVDALEEQTLSPEWVDWLIDNYVEGVPRDALLETLTAEGVPLRLAKRVLDELAQTIALRSLRRKIAGRDQLLQLAHLKRLLEIPTLAELLVRREKVSREEFFSRYYGSNRPVILTDVTTDWPALQRWKSADYFAEKFGDEALDVCMGREKDPKCDKNFANFVSHMTMRDYANWVNETKESNDGYLISNNRLLENKAFHPLLGDIIPPEKYVDKSRFLTFMSFWFGPAGTFTPLHHDGNNILFCQVVGRKEFYLVSPWETDLLANADGYYAHKPIPRGMTEEGLRPADEAFPYPAVRIVLSPGEALFLPVGWWHQVRALDQSVSISFLNFWQNNHFEWYAPGKLNFR